MAYFGGNVTMDLRDEDLRHDTRHGYGYQHDGHSRNDRDQNPRRYEGPARDMNLVPDYDQECYAPRDAANRHSLAHSEQQDYNPGNERSGERSPRGRSLWERSSEEWSPRERLPREMSPRERSPNERSEERPEERSPRRRSLEEWVPRERSPRELLPMEKSSEERSPMERLSEKRSPRGRSLDEWVPREKSPMERSPYERSPRERSSQEWLPRERSPRERSSQEWLPRERSPRERSSQEWLPRERSPRERSSQEWLPRERSPRERSSQEWLPRERSPRERSAQELSLREILPRVCSEQKRKSLSDDGVLDPDYDIEDKYDGNKRQHTTQYDIQSQGNYFEDSDEAVIDRSKYDDSDGIYEELVSYGGDLSSPVRRSFHNHHADDPSHRYRARIDNEVYEMEEDSTRLSDSVFPLHQPQPNHTGDANFSDTLDGTKTQIVRRRTKQFMESVQGNDDEVASLNRTSMFEYLPSHKQTERKSLHHKVTSLRQQKTLHGVASVYRNQIIGEPVSKTKGYAAWRQTQAQAWQRFKQQAKSWLYQLEPWAGALKEVEGQFGTSIMGYFRFVRWLMFLNMYICLVNICLTLLPHFVLYDSPRDFITPLIQGSNITVYEQEAVNCTIGYKEEIQTNNDKSNVFSNVLDFLQGTGWMEDTVLFYGTFFNKTYTNPLVGGTDTYHMGLSYLLATGLSFIMSFFVIVKNSSKGLKDTAVIHGATMAMYSNKVLTGWDFCILQENSAKTKHSNIGGELKKDLEIQRFQWKMASRTTSDKVILYLVRTVINILTCILLGGSLYLIYLSFSQLLKLQKEFGDTHPAVQFLIQYLPSVSITVLNIVVPIIFKKLVLLEDYTPSFEMTMTLLRTILLRLSSLGVLLISIYQLLQSDDAQLEHRCGNKRWATLPLYNTTTNATTTGSIIKCWETYVGQQIYKLVILDFIVLIVVTFLIELPRRVMYRALSEKLKLINMVGLPEVDLPKVVLDIVYAQTLCWMGLFFSPLIPFISFLKCFIVFYVKKFTLLNNYVAPTRPYRTTRSNSLFIGMLFISFLIAAIPVTYMIGNFDPSQGCGPFRVYSTNSTVFFDTVEYVILRWPKDAQDVFFFLGNTRFFIPAMLVMCLIMYYYWTVKEGLTKMEELLEEQLKLEGQDKQFLLARVNDIVQHIDS